MALDVAVENRIDSVLPEASEVSVRHSARPLREAVGACWRSVGGYIWDNSRDWTVAGIFAILVILGFGAYKLSETPMTYQARPGNLVPNLTPTPINR